MLDQIKVIIDETIDNAIVAVNSVLGTEDMPDNQEMETDYFSLEVPEIGWEVQWGGENK